MNIVYSIGPLDKQKNLKDLLNIFGLEEEEKLDKMKNDEENLHELQNQMNQADQNVRLPFLNAKKMKFPLSEDLLELHRLYKRNKCKIGFDAFTKQTYFPTENKVAEMMFTKPAGFYTYFAQYHREYHRYVKNTFCHQKIDPEDKLATTLYNTITTRERNYRILHAGLEEEAQPMWKIIRAYLEEILIKAPPAPERSQK